MVTDASLDGDGMVSEDTIVTSCRGITPISAPVLDSFPQTTPYALYPFEGLAPEATLITAKGAANAAPRQVGADGRFCIEVQLVQDAYNEITFKGLSKDGCEGMPTVVQITHQTAQNQDAGGLASPANVAPNSPVFSDKNPSNLDTINNGRTDEDVKSSTNKPVTLKFGDGYVPLWGDNDCDDEFTWIRFDLGKNLTVYTVRIYWALNVGKNFARCYSVVTSTVANPSAPTTKEGQGWQDNQGMIQNGDAKPDEIDMKQVTARHVAILLRENNNKSSGNPIDYNQKNEERFDIAEIEIVAQDPDATPTTAPISCQ